MLKQIIFSLLIFASILAQANSRIVNFKSWQEAKNYYDDDLADLVAELTADESYQDVLPHSYKGYARIEAIIKRVSEAYFNKFPLLNPEAPTPYVIIIDSDDHNASAVENPKTLNRPNLFIFNKKSLEATDNQLQGVIAHEMAHLYFQYSTNVDDHPKDKNFYRVWDEVKFGPDIVNDPKADQIFDKYKAMVDQAGVFSNPELGGVPWGGISTNFRFILYLLEHKASSEKCNGANQLFGQLLKMQNKYFNESDARLDGLNDRQTRQLAQIGKKFESELHKCFGGLKMRYVDLYEKAHDISHEDFLEISANYKLEEKIAFLAMNELFKSNDAITAILEAGRSARQEIQHLEATKYFYLLTNYNHEDEADEISIYVLLQAGLVADGINLFLSTYDLENQKCDFSHEPPYGTLTESHHSTCWRIYRNTKYLEFLRALTPEQRDQYINRPGFL